MTRELAVVGGGITGLAAAYQATEVTDVVVTLHEASDRLGGKIRTSVIELADGTRLRIDEGADAFLARVPDATELCIELGLEAELTHPAVGRAQVLVGGQLRFLPEHTVLGVPTDLDRLAAAELLDEAALAEVAAEWRHDAAPLAGDVAIGPFLRQRYGNQLVDRVVGPLIGGINAGDVDQLSLAAVTPQLAEAARDGGSLSVALARRSAPSSGAPVFNGLLPGTGHLIDVLAHELDQRGVTLRTGSAVASLDELGADAVVLTTPAPDAARLLASHSPEAAALLDEIRHSAVALVTFVFDADDVHTDPRASGLLVPPGEGLLMTAASFGSTKWSHWDDGRHVVLRVSAGRTGDERQAAMSDDELVAALAEDLRAVLGIDAAPLAARVSRWPLGFAQYGVDHLDRVERIDAALARDCPEVVVAGAAYRGLGLPACIRQGRDAARRLLGG